jgi:Outer membrane protein beta-barrel domain
MTPLRITLIALVSAMLFSTAAAAQERGQIGIGMGYPGSISLMWHITDAVAVRPDVRFRWTGGSDIEAETTTVAFGIAGLWYFARHDGLTMYVSPRFEYAHTSLEYDIRLAIPALSPQDLSALGLPIASFPQTYDASSSTKSFSGSFGAQYAVHKRFSVFGEAGLDYQKVGRPDFLGSLSSVIARSTDGPRSWGTRSAVGVIIYFKD